jgi:hypothetical protein
MTARNRGSVPPGVGASPLPATRARVWWLASASGSSFPSADVRAPACGFGRVQPGLARRRRALEKARPESCHRLGQTRASDSRAVNRSTASGPVVIQHVGADLSTYWARTEQPLQKRHTQPLHGPDFVPYRRLGERSFRSSPSRSVMSSIDVADALPPTRAAWARGGRRRARRPSMTRAMSRPIGRILANLTRHMRLRAAAESATR